MQYIVHGVDRSSGQETSLALSAANAAEAESIASLSMLVAEVKVDKTPVAAVSYAQPNLDARFDWATGIVRQAAILRMLSWMMAAVGLLGAMWALAAELAEFSTLGILDSIAKLLRYIAPHADLQQVVWILVSACLMRLTAHFLLGLRELLLQKIERRG